MQVAIVTGASSGIGFGCATKLAEAGMAMVGAGRDEARLAELEKAIDDPERVATIAVDLTADDAPKRIVDARRASAGATSTSWSTMPAWAVRSRCTKPTTGPLEDHGGAAVAHHDAVLGERLGGLDHEARG